jgi:hypothetical protein
LSQNFTILKTTYHINTDNIRKIIIWSQAESHHRPWWVSILKHMVCASANWSLRFRVLGAEFPKAVPLQRYV